jgi:hypothetical protein
MLIRSQDREVLINFNSMAGAEIAEGPIKTIITSYITGCSYPLGEYSNKAKAMKVLDMIQEAYSEYQIMLNFSVSYLHEFKEKTDGFAIFQMPEDSEVEV